MKVIKRLKFLAIIFLILPLQLSFTITAQNTLFAGDTIRISMLNARGKLEGILKEIKKDTITFRQNEKQFSIPFKKIKNLEVARGSESHTIKGMTIGGLVSGGALGLIAAISSIGEKGFMQPSPPAAFLGGFILGGLPGALIGAIFGSAETPNWQDVELKDIQFKNKIISFPKTDKNPTPVTKIDKKITAVPPVNKKKTVSTTTLNKNRLAVSTVETKAKSKMPSKNWWVELTLATTSQGPAEKIEKAMVRDGYNETSPGGFFSSPKSHPFSNNGFGEIGIPWSLQVNRYLSKNLNLGIIVGNTPIGETKGYRKNPNQHLNIEYSTFLICPVIFIKMSESVQLGLGPSIFWNKVHASVTLFETKSKIGALIQFRITYPQNTLFYVKFDAEYRLIPKIDFGPLKETGNETFGLNQFETNFSHTFIGLGIGIHV